MTVQEILGQCRELGVNLAPGPGGKLRASPPGKLPEELREELRRHRAEILAFLQAKEEKPRELLCRYCGGIARHRDGKLSLDGTGYL